MTIREAWEKKKAAQAAAGQAAARSGETVAPKGRQPGKLKKLFSKTGMAIAATTMLTAAVAATTGQGSGSGSGSGDCSGSSCEIEGVTGKKIKACCTGQATFPCCMVWETDEGGQAVALCLTDPRDCKKSNFE